MASQALGLLHTMVFNQHNVHISTKLKVYRAVVIPSLLYGSESSSSLSICWQDYISNLEVSNLKSVDSTSIGSLIIRAQMGGTCHQNA